MYETYKSANLLGNGILTVTTHGIAAYTKWVSLKHVSAIVVYDTSSLMGRLSLHVTNGDIVHIEGEQNLLYEIIDAWGVL